MTGEATGEIRTWSLLGVKGLTPTGNRYKEQQDGYGQHMSLSDAR